MFHAKSPLHTLVELTIHEFSSFLCQDTKRPPPILFSFFFFPVNLKPFVQQHLQRSVLGARSIALQVSSSLPFASTFHTVRSPPVSQQAFVIRCFGKQEEKKSTCYSITKIDRTAFEREIGFLHAIMPRVELQTHRFRSCFFVVSSHQDDHSHKFRS